MDRATDAEIVAAAIKVEEAREDLRKAQNYRNSIVCEREAREVFKYQEAACWAMHRVNHGFDHETNWHTAQSWCHQCRRRSAEHLVVFRHSRIVGGRRAGVTRMIRNRMGG